MPFGHHRGAFYVYGLSLRQGDRLFFAKQNGKPITQGIGLLPCIIDL
ncbi:MAG: hypothetical protein ACI4T0_01355 [Candidatus Limisoma sp.]